MSEWPMFDVEVPGRGTFLFEALDPFDAIDLSEEFSKVKGKRTASRGYAEAGAVIGRCWRGGVELPEPNGAPAMEYGREVIRTFHREGWTLGQITALVTGSGRAMGAEVEERADFSEAPEDGAG